MRVTHLSTYHLAGGAAVAATRLHRALNRQGHFADSVESILLVGTAARQEKHQPEESVTYLANNFLAEQTAFGRFVAERLSFLPFERDPSVRFQFSPATFGTNLNFHPIIQQTDILHLHWINQGFLALDGLQALFALGKPVVWTLHDQWAFTGGCHYSHGCDHFRSHCRQCPYLKKPGEQDLSYRIFERKKRMFANAPVHFVSPSQWLSDEGQRSALLREFPFSTIPNTLDQNLFQPIDREQASARFDLPTGTAVRPFRILFGSANVTDPRKGFRYFAEALQQLHQQQPDLTAEVLVFGKGRSYLFNELPYPVRHLGQLSDEADIVAAYNAADALVVPSLEDNLPNTIVESLACGTPVVGFRTGGIPELIEHQQNGFLAAVGSAEELAAGLDYVLTHPSPGTLRQNARQSAELRFSEEVVTVQYLDLYRALLNG
ncbi:glycosyltransferase [Spirosoma taeanense]|uniref:Glycosyltransferase n=1 Tax=Spirosoma taeanense TaxID=2735870 RepID=A0A6M5YCU0_9BACT|nr:glycosyltransferase family 4 protein [Spirosoma taeanense]QJW91093.1 glycosyltransferase [Spirosoma taeanense]